MHFEGRQWLAVDSEVMTYETLRVSSELNGEDPWLGEFSPLFGIKQNSKFQ